MINFIPEKLQDFKYYENLVPMYLKSDEMFLQNLKIYFDFLTSREVETIELPSNVEEFDTRVIKTYESVSAIGSRLLEQLDIFDLQSANFFDFAKNITFASDNCTTTASSYTIILDKDQDFTFEITDLSRNLTLNFENSEGYAYSMFTEEASVSRDDILEQFKEMSEELELDIALDVEKITISNYRREIRFSAKLTTYSPERQKFLSNFLDKLAHLETIDRTVVVEYQDDEQHLVKEEITLTDEELLLYIKCQVMKNNYDGSRQRMKWLYSITNLPILILTDPDDMCTCNVYLALTSNDQVSDNIKKLFLSGKISLESVGVKYKYAIVVADNLLLFDNEDESHALQVYQDTYTDDIGGKLVI